MPPKLFAPTKAAAKRIGDAVRQVLDGVPGQPPGGRRRFSARDGAMFVGKLVDDLASPDNGWTSATHARMRIYLPDPEAEEPDPDDYVPRAFIAAEPSEEWTVNVVNRDPSLDVAAGIFVMVRHQFGEWQVVYVGC